MLPELSLRTPCFDTPLAAKKFSRVRVSKPATLRFCPARPCYTESARAVFSQRRPKYRSGEKTEMRVARRQWPCTASRRDGNLSTRRPLKGKADGAIELSEDHDAETYRALNAVELEDMVYVLHCFHKKGKTRAETPKKEIDVIEQRLYRGLRRPIPLLWMISCPRLPASRASFLGRSEPTLSQESATIFRPGSEEFLPEIVKRSASYRRLPFIENASNFRRGATLRVAGFFRRASYKFRSS